MGPDRFERWGGGPMRLDYQSRIRRAPQRAAWPTHAQPVTTAVRATAATVVAACLSVAVPCVVFAVVGWWFDDISTADAAWVAAGSSAGAALAAVPAIACHLRLCQRRPTAGPASWN